MLTIYKYKHASRFLYDAWEEKKKRNPAFSMRAWAKKLGMQNISPLSLMLNGKRPIPRKYVPFFIKDLSLSSIEGMYLENLIEFNRAASMEEKDFYLKRLERLHPKKKVHFEEVEMHDFFKDPIHFYLLDIVELDKSTHDIHWIEENLCLPYSVNEIKKALKRLEEHRFIVKGKERYIKLKGQFKNKIDIPSETVQNYHRSCSKNAMDALETQPVGQREYNGFVLRFNTKDIKDAKEDIRKFYTDFISKYERKEEADSLYQLNSQFFKVFKTETEH